LEWCVGLTGGSLPGAGLAAIRKVTAAKAKKFGNRCFISFTQGWFVGLSLEKQKYRRGAEHARRKSRVTGQAVRNS